MSLKSYLRRTSQKLLQPLLIQNLALNQPSNLLDALARLLETQKRRHIVDFVHRPEDVLGVSPPKHTN